VQQKFLKQVLNQWKLFKINLKILALGLTLDSSQQNFLLNHYQTENYVTWVHIDFPLTFPIDDKNQTFPIRILKFRNAEQHTRDWLVWSHGFNKVSLLLTTKCTTICIFSADSSVYEPGLLVYIVCVKNCAHNHPENLPGNITHKHSFNTLGIFEHDSVRACADSFQKLIHKIFL